MIFNRNNAIIKLVEHFAWHCDDYSHILRYGFNGYESLTDDELIKTLLEKKIPYETWCDKFSEELAWARDTLLKSQLL